MQKKQKSYEKYTRLKEINKVKYIKMFSVFNNLPCQPAQFSEIFEWLVLQSISHIIKRPAKKSQEKFLKIFDTNNSMTNRPALKVSV